MTFYVHLILAPEKYQTEGSKDSLMSNCTHVTRDYWIFEGDGESLLDDGVMLQYLGDGFVECLGDMNETELIKLCSTVFGYDIPKEGGEK